MPDQKYAIRYPRRIVLRFFMRLLGRLLLKVLTRTKVVGWENLPKSGPVILVGNHVAIMEVMMMALFVPWPIEIIGTGDIPIDPRFAWMTKLWGFIPVSRGSVDRDEMRLPIDVLKQNGVIGIFPEGGIWENQMKKARTGVAWLSYRNNAPIVPIGFGGMRGALQAALSFKRPQLVMNIGKVMPAVDPKVAGMSRKEALEYAANNIMAHVAALIPEDEKKSWRQVLDERFDFNLYVRGLDGSGNYVDQEVQVMHPVGLGKFFHRPIILDVMSRNMNLSVSALQNLGTEHDSQRLADAIDVALKFLDDNPYFLSYRFGYEQAADMYAGVKELQDIARDAASKGQLMTLQPIRHYRREGEDQEITEMLPGVVQEM
ncbi:MAG: 1-acyl-sn-glycerol-3-phosphate acyltransferase [Anaerolineae bacterium]|nr:1-acyl-sn-glycerol-3-phosphate acyltransferase [Anaerolineae bacterium]